MGKTHKKRIIKFRKTGGVGNTPMWKRHAAEHAGTANIEMEARKRLYEKARATASKEQKAAEKRGRNLETIYNVTQKKFEYEKPDNVDYIYPPIKTTESGVASWVGPYSPGYAVREPDMRPLGIKDWGAGKLGASTLSPKEWATIWKTSKPGLGRPAIEQRFGRGLFAPLGERVELMYDIRNDPNIDPNDPIKAVPPNYRVHQGSVRPVYAAREASQNVDDDEHMEEIATKMQKDWEDDENMRRMTMLLVRLWKTCQYTSLTNYERRIMYNKAKLLVDKMVREKGANKTKEYLKNAPGAVIPYPLPRFELSCGIDQFTDDELAKVKRQLAFDASEAAFIGDDPSSIKPKRVGSPQSNIDYLRKQDEDEGFVGISDLRRGGRYKKNRKTIKHKKKHKLRKSKKKY
jgi:hypothetical protein